MRKSILFLTATAAFQVHAGNFCPSTPAERLALYTKIYLATDDDSRHGNLRHVDSDFLTSIDNSLQKAVIPKGQLDEGLELTFTSSETGLQEKVRLPKIELSSGDFKTLQVHLPASGMVVPVEISKIDVPPLVAIRINSDRDLNRTGQQVEAKQEVVTVENQEEKILEIRNKILMRIAGNGSIANLAVRNAKRARFYAEDQFSSKNDGDRGRQQANTDQERFIAMVKAKLNQNLSELRCVGDSELLTKIEQTKKNLNQITPYGIEGGRGLGGK